MFPCFECQCGNRSGTRRVQQSNRFSKIEVSDFGIGNDHANKLSAKVDSAKLEKLTLSSKTAAIDGGVILRSGDVETNCSLALIFSELRERLESEVGRVLFEEKTKI